MHVHVCVYVWVCVKSTRIIRRRADIEGVTHGSLTQHPSPGQYRPVVTVMPVFFSPGPQTLRAGLSYVGSAVFANNRTTDSDVALEQDDRSGSHRSYRVPDLPS